MKSVLILVSFYLLLVNASLVLSAKATLFDFIYFEEMFGCRKFGTIVEI